MMKESRFVFDTFQTSLATVQRKLDSLEKELRQTKLENEKLRRENQRLQATNTRLVSGLGANQDENDDDYNILSPSSISKVDPESPSKGNIMPMDIVSLESINSQPNHHEAEEVCSIHIFSQSSKQSENNNIDYNNNEKENIQPSQSQSSSRKEEAEALGQANDEQLASPSNIPPSQHSIDFRMGNSFPSVVFSSQIDLPLNGNDGDSALNSQESVISNDEVNQVINPNSSLSENNKYQIKTSIFNIDMNQEGGTDEKHDLGHITCEVAEISPAKESDKTIIQEARGMYTPLTETKYILGKRPNELITNPKISLAKKRLKSNDRRYKGKKILQFKGNDSVKFPSLKEPSSPSPSKKKRTIIGNDSIMDNTSMNFVNSVSVPALSPIIKDKLTIMVPKNRTPTLLPDPRGPFATADSPRISNHKPSQALPEFRSLNIDLIEELIRSKKPINLTLCPLSGKKWTNQDFRRNEVDIEEHEFARLQKSAFDAVCERLESSNPEIDPTLCIGDISSASFDQQDEDESMEENGTPCEKCQYLKSIGAMGLKLMSPGWDTTQPITNRYREIMLPCTHKEENKAEKLRKRQIKKEKLQLQRNKRLQKQDKVSALPATPPGFFRSEFPTSEERKKDHEEVMRRTNKEVVSKFLVAMGVEAKALSKKQSKVFTFKNRVFNNIVAAGLGVFDWYELRELYNYTS
ncbi:hypothetical protein DASC09_046850 [Saccharomycopsis crataegensis]|uniref:Uncharacterized protein n=1 Tax=Saccharomycopsis crataegensis TaxID=43959 RepID=A0AAV5QQZ3_9ASCO|nr:hypothetical protein DASC09_046850 [Saccharomycopsis crataegensis]